MDNSSDEKLMQLVLERNADALKTLYNRYSMATFNFILRYTGNRELSEDLLQETFSRCWFAAHTFNPRKGALKNWLFTIARNATRNEMSKKMHRYQHIEIDELNASPTNSLRTMGCAESDLEKLELKSAINAALGKLKPYLREVVVLKHFHKLKFREISEITDTPEGTLKARFHYAVAQLKDLLKHLELENERM